MTQAEVEATCKVQRASRPACQYVEVSQRLVLACGEQKVTILRIRRHGVDVYVNACAAHIAKIGEAFAETLDKEATP